MAEICMAEKPALSDTLFALHAALMLTADVVAHLLQSPLGGPRVA